MTDTELNQAVARKLGWEYVEWEGVDETDAFPHKKSGWIKEKSHIPWSLPDYCHSIEAAWEIVEHVRTKYAFDFHSSPDKYFANFSGPTWKQMVSAEEDTAPLAICNAFLKLP